MKITETTILPGIGLHTIQTKKFKTILLRMIIRTPLNKETAGANALIAQLTSRASVKYPDVMAVNRRLDELFGAYYSGDVGKTGETHTLEWTLAFPVPARVGRPELLEEAMTFLRDMVLDPPIVNGGFDEVLFQREKSVLIQDIESRINDKMTYAYERCIEVACEEEPFGVHRYGDVQSLQGWNPVTLADYYKTLLKTAAIDFVVVGDVEGLNLSSVILQQLGLEERIPTAIPRETIRTVGRGLRVDEALDVQQGKLNLAFTTGIPYEHEDYDALLLFSGVLGGGASSRLFQTVREKESLCYSIYARLEKYKSLLLVGAGIDLDKAPVVLEKIQQEMTKIRNGEFTHEELELAKMTITRSLNALKDSQTSLADYYFNQFLSGKRYHIDDTLASIWRRSKEDVIRSAVGVQLDAVYFMKGMEA